MSMGKIVASSWLNVVKKAFRSPTKDNNTKRSSRRRDEHEQEQEQEEKSRGKRRWIFKKSSPHETTINHNEAINIPLTTTSIAYASTTMANEPVVHEKLNQGRVIAVAEAASVTVQTAVDVTRFTRPSIFVRDYAAISIQTAFRGYLARKALRALKGLVKLQALVRGYNVRKRAKMTLQCMQSLIRVQARFRDQRIRLSYEGSKDSSSTDPNKLSESYFANRKSISRDGSNITDEWDSHPNAMEEINMMPLRGKGKFSNCEEDTLAQAFYHQMWRSGKDQFLINQEQEAKSIWYDMAATMKQCERMGRNSFDQTDPTIKIVEMDTAQTCTYSAPKFNRSPNTYHRHQKEPHSHSVSTPIHRTHRNLSVDSPSSPSLMNKKPPKLHSASPHYSPRQDRDLLTTYTPSLGSSYYHRNDASDHNDGGNPIPNYMAATTSTKARLRSQSAPRHRPMTTKRENVVLSKKRLSFPVQDPDDKISMSDVESNYNFRRPSCDDHDDSCTRAIIGAKRWLR